MPAKRSLPLLLSAFVLFLALASLLNALPTPAQAAADLTIYDDALASGWVDWSWDGTYNFSNASPVHAGSASVAATFEAAWAGLYLHADPAISTSGYSAISFWVHGGAGGGQSIAVAVNFGASTYEFTAPAGSWSQVTIPLADLGSPAAITDLTWQDTTGGAQPTFYLDDIILVGDNSTSTPTLPPGTGPALSVNAAASRHDISPYIYGMNFTDENLAEELGLPVRRWGGNHTSRYNWELDITNQGMDWYYENYQEDPAHTRLEQFLEQDLRTETRSLVTMPLMGWTPKNDPLACGFSIAKYGAQDDNDWEWRPDCGNGLSGGVNVVGNDPLDTSYATTPAYVSDWIANLVSVYGTAAQGGVLFYGLDNEPMLWYDTHRDVHPQPTSYDELRDKTYAIAAAIKAADPSAQTVGPVLWGWTAYFWSALDFTSGGSWWLNPPDRNAHGGMAFSAWYLQQMQDYETQNGVRILDYLDLHYYPQANGVSLSPAGNADTQALRLRSTRALWDPTYEDESWIGGAAEGPYVRLIPRMQEWVDAYYPGTKLAMTEYNWGGLEHINGALAQADVLGIFGREGMDLANLWDPPTSGQPGAYAFRIYLNYDGLGHGFGETGVQASSTDQGQLAIYAAERTADGALTLVIINKTANAFTSTVSLAGFTPAASAQVFRYSAVNLNAIVQQPDQAVTASGFTADFPANSITLVIIPPGTPVPTATPTSTIPTATPTATTTPAPPAAWIYIPLALR